MTEQRAWHHASVRELPGVLVTAGKLFLAHWPAFLVLACLAIALRNGALWAAVELSDWHGFAGQILLVLAPIGYLLPAIAMLHLCRRSLATEPSDAVRPESRLVDVATSVLVPFLAVYVSHGLLADDVERFVNEASADEYFSNQLSGDADFFGRVLIWSGWSLVGVIAAAWVLRWALGRAEKRSGLLLFAIAGVLAEIYWTGNVAHNASALQAHVVGWVEDRRAVHGIVTTYDATVDRLGPLAHPVETATDWLFGTLGAFDAVVVVPLAWLTVAAVVLGHQLMEPPATDRHPVLDRVKVIPAPVRSGLASLTEDVRGRFSALWQGLRMLGSAGLAPMLLFGVTFLIVLRLPGLVSRLWRAVTGPVDTWTWLAFAPIESALGLAVSLMLAVPLLAAAVSWLTRAAPAGTSTTPGRESRATPA
ncbi:hypothetical protein [Nocardioides sp.]|uniref:hypothetical protein n=1 Tax=Nocardioides sp. TaxID=35761 RepID=UPI002CAD1EDF|nr:hypothetical protein [Nocardioides sp.]HSX69238.1 hypothetical protein [Nocardioides sp.]